MREKRVRDLMAELAEWGVIRVHLAGGEPTINRRALENYLDSASENGLYTSMATNGLLIDDEVLDIIFRNKPEVGELQH
jgi:MoaA/NifB/PqqE/SkfB family radical SAM enzyme